MVKVLMLKIPFMLHICALLYFDTPFEYYTQISTRALIT